MGKLIPVILIVLGLGAGLGGGLLLRPVPDTETTDEEAAQPPPLPDATAIGLFEFENQFMVPIVVEDRITSVIVLRLALEIRDEHRGLVSSVTPRLRDRLLQVMFDHANMGGFQGNFTANDTLRLLRANLLEAAQATLGPDIVFGVLITDLLRTGS